MDAMKYISEIRFASPLFILLALAIVTILFYVLRGRRTIEHSYIGFFRRNIAKKSRNPLFWVYRLLIYIVAATLVLAAGNPVHEGVAKLSSQITPYCFVLDSSGSLTAFNFDGEVSSSFEDSPLNSIRISLIKFIKNRKANSEFFLMLYSDTPYAARYFAGGEEAETQIIGFLEELPDNTRRQVPSRTFYFKGTRTAFALDAAARYYHSFPDEYASCVFVLITDFEDTEPIGVAKAINNLQGKNPDRNMYIVIVVLPDAPDNTSQFKANLENPSKVRIFAANNESSIDAALYTIGEYESSPGNMNFEILQTQSLQRYFIYFAVLGILMFIALEELIYRKVP